MVKTPNEGASKGWRASPVAPALIGAASGLLGVALGAFVVLRQGALQQGLADRDNGLKVAEVRRQIIVAAGDFDMATLEVLLQYTLRPIDPEGYEGFRRSMMDLVATKAAGSDPRAQALQDSSAATVPSLQSNDPKQMVTLLGTADRLSASNRLLELYVSKPSETVQALIGSIIPEAPQNNSYTVNLYVAFTLGRLRPPWRGSEAQRQIVASLKEHRSYRDPTFRLRVDQALANIQP